MKSGLAKVSMLVLFWVLLFFLDTRATAPRDSPPFRRLGCRLRDGAGPPFHGASGAGPGGKDVSGRLRPGVSVSRDRRDVLIVEIFSLYCPHCQRWQAG